MIDWILSSSLLILVVVGTRAIFKDKISQRLRYALWALVLLRLLIPVNIGHSVISTANFSASIQNRQAAVSAENRVQNQNGTLRKSIILEGTDSQNHEIHLDCRSCIGGR